MQQKEIFLKTKKGKIVFGSVTGSIVLLLSILLLCWYTGTWPFSSTKITDKDIEVLQKELNNDDKTIEDRLKILTNFEDKVKKVNSEIKDDNNSKKIELDEIKPVKDQLESLKGKEKKDITDENKKQLKEKVDTLATYLKKQIKEINK